MKQVKRFETVLSGPAWSRRDFLSGMSSGLLILSLPVLSACGGGGGGSDVDGGENPLPAGDPVDELTRLEVLGAVSDRVNALHGNYRLTPADILSGTAAYMQTLPAYLDVGVSAQLGTAWGVFTDGRVHIVALNRKPNPYAAQSMALEDPFRYAAATRTEVPGAPKALVLHSFGANFDDVQQVVTNTTTWLKDKGYTVRPVAEGDAHLTVLRTVSGEGFLYINTHGGHTDTLNDGSGITMYAIQSSTLVTFASEHDPLIRDDIDNRRLTYFTAPNGTYDKDQKPILDTRYAINSYFVDRYWKLATDSVVIINACDSARDDGGFAFALHKAGAGVVMAWTGSVSGEDGGGAYPIPSYFIDRLLGANKEKPEVRPQRPFDWASVLADMERKGLTVDGKTLSRFVARPRPGSPQVQSLAPSIHYLQVDELHDELILFGLFGSRPGKVWVEGTPLANIRSWAYDRIRCELPRTGAGRAGAVIVEVGGIHSNVRHITEWALNLDYLWALPGMPGPQVAGTVQLRLRADIAERREAAGADPVAARCDAYATRDSGLNLVASGAFPTPGCAVIWSGSAKFPAIPEETDPTVLQAYLQVDSETRQAALGLALGAKEPVFTQSVCDAVGKFSTGFGTLDALVSFANPLEGAQPIPLSAILFDFDSAYRIPGGTRTGEQLTLTWQTSTPFSPPEAKDPI